jgi:repressor LexA
MSAALPNLSPNAPVLRRGRNRDDDHLAAMQCHWKAYRTFPPMAKLVTVLGLSSTAGVFGVIRRLTDAGYLQRVDRRIAPTKRFFERPVLGAIRAGVPRLETQGHESLTLDDYLVDDPARTSLHRVRGDSMRDMGILDGDLAVVEHRAPTQPGDVVLAVSDGGMTVKTLRRGDDGGYFLEPANPAFEPIYPQTSLEVLGVVIGVVRRLRR